MNSKYRHAWRAVAVASALAIPVATWAGDRDSDDFRFRDMSAQWWAWALSIPTSVNPLLDNTDPAPNCMVGQRGPVWFLAGYWLGGTFSRGCTVPEGVTLFFPVYNYFEVDTPQVCGQGAPVPVAEMRGRAKASIDSITKVTATIDGRDIPSIRRATSPRFPLAFPADNFFATDCAPYGGFPAGIYSPSISDGYWVKLDGLSPGEHLLHFTADKADVQRINGTYRLTVVPVAGR